MYYINLQRYVCMYNKFFLISIPLCVSGTLVHHHSVRRLPISIFSPLLSFFSSVLQYLVFLYLLKILASLTTLS
ncbi:hypothetical protein V1511DRAFT_504030 [Dipodascopsis uninucleata]